VTPKDKKTAILQAAMTCISKYGIENTKTQVIAKELGVAQSGLFYHFRNNDELFDSLIPQIVTVNHGIVEKLRQTKKPKDNLSALRLYAMGNLYWAHKHPEQVAVLLYSVMRTSYSTFMRKTMTQVQNTGENTIYGILTAGVAEKEFSVDGDLREMAKFIHNTLIGATIAFHTSRHCEGYKKVYDRFAEKLDLLIHKKGL
jgi:AcrR family transcriptional regulator